MRRLVVALTALLALVGVAVVAAYLLFVAGAGDRAAGAVPADSALYLRVYLQPSSGQKQSLLGLLGHLQGFSDVATREEKLHEITQRLLGQVGIDYGADLRPWLGGQVALSAAPPAQSGAQPRLLLLASVKDRALARAAVPRLMTRKGVTYAPETYRGHRAMMSPGLSYVLLDDLLLVANSPERLREALDAEANTIPSLGDLPAFDTAMGSVAGDRLASLYLDLGRAAGLDGKRLGGFGTAALSLTARADGLHLDGKVPFAAGDASDAARAAFALGTRTAGLTAWMSPATAAEVSIFGAKQSITDLEKQVGGDSLLGPALDLLSQLRLVAGLGLGIDADRDLLPLFDGEAAVALTRLDPGGPRGVLLLRPSDAAGAQAALDKMRDALITRGSATSTSQASGSILTTIAVPQIGRLTYAVADGVVLASLDAADVAAALEAHRGGTTLDADPRYEPAFAVAGAHAGNEIWADLPALVDAASGIFDPGTEVRDILHQIGELAMSASTVGDHLEIHAVLTVR